MFGLHGGKVVIGTTDKVVAAGGKLKNRDVGCRSERGCLLEEAFRIVEERIESSRHIRLIDANGKSFRNLTKESPAARGRVRLQAARCRRRRPGALD